MSKILEVKDLNVSYGLINAVKGVSFYVDEGEIVSLIGANGAGKTTIMNSICSILPYKGSVKFNNTDISRLKAHKITALGLSLVPEGRRIFSELSVKDNLIMGAYTVKDNKLTDGNLEEVYTLFPRLKERERQIAGTLSGGEQQMLALARALMSSPKMLLLDEPSMGLSPLYVNMIFEALHKLNEKGMTIFLVEQNAKKAMTLSSRTYVLEIGKITLEGSSAELMNDPKVRSAYLGA